MGIHIVGLKVDVEESDQIGREIVRVRRVVCCLGMWFGVCALLYNEASAVDFGLGAQGGVRLRASSGKPLMDVASSKIQQSKWGWGLLLGLFGDVEFNERTSLLFQVDFGEWFIGGSTLQLGQETKGTFTLQHNQFWRYSNITDVTRQHKGMEWLFEESFFLRELYMTFALDRNEKLMLNAGLMHHEMAGGRLYDEYALGLFFELGTAVKRRHHTKKRLLLGLFLPDSSFTAGGKQSPVVHAEYRYSSREGYGFWRRDFQISGFAVYLRDGDSLLGKRLMPVWNEYYPTLNTRGLAPTCQLLRSRCQDIPQTSGNHAWVGIAFNVESAVSARGSVVYQYASSSLKNGETDENLSTWGLLIDLELGVQFSMLGISLFTMITPHGELQRTDKQNASVMAPFRLAPNLRQLNLWNHSGNSFSSQRKLALSDWLGQSFVGGLHLKLVPGRRSANIGVDFRLAFVQRAYAGPSDGLGLETNFRIHWSFDTLESNGISRGSVRLFLDVDNLLSPWKELGSDARQFQVLIGLDFRAVVFPGD